MKTIVIYRSISGYTRKYAEWIADDLKADLAEFNKISLHEILEHDQIIFGGRIIASGIDGINIIKKNLGRFGNRRIIIFGVGAGPEKKEAIDEMRNKNLTQEEQERIKMFYMRGGFDFRKLGFLDKLMMNVMRLVLLSKKEKTDEQKKLLASYAHPVDFTNKKNTEELIRFAKKGTEKNTIK